MAKKVELSVEEEEKLEVNTKKILKEITKELDNKQNEIIGNISKKVEDQAELAVNKKMKEVEKTILRGKNAKIIRRDLLVLLLIALATFEAYCLWKVDYFDIRTKVVEKVPIKDRDDSKIPNESTEPNNEKSLEMLISEYGFLLDSLNVQGQDALLLYEKNASVDDLSNDIKLKIAYNNLTDKKDDGKTISFSYSSLVEQAKKIFGSNVSLVKDMFTYNNTRFMVLENNYIGYKEKESDVSFKYNILDVKEDNDILTFEVIVAYEKGNKLYDVKNREIDNKFNNQELDNYKDKLDKYLITFAKENDNFVFKKIEDK